MSYRSGLVFAAALLLAGCQGASFPPAQGGPAWKDADDQGVPLATGGNECKYQAKVGATAATGLSKQESVAQDLFDSCMRRRGY